MTEITQRIADWNAKRYEREYSHSLTVDLLREEYEEWITAVEDVDKLDALCDLIFVAIGAIWKLGDEPAATEVLGPPPKYHGYAIGMMIDILENELDVEPLGLLAAIADLAVYEMINGLHLDDEQVERAILTVCDSNDTKSIVKTDSNVKANLDKGPYFRPPEAKLQEILCERS